MHVTANKHIHHLCSDHSSLLDTVDLKRKKYSVKSRLAVLESPSRRKSVFLDSCSYYFTRSKSAADRPLY